MVVLLDFVSLLVLLNSARSTVLAGEKESPIVNVTLDSRKKILSWNSRRIVTQQTCGIVTPLDPDTSQEPQVRNNDTYFCTFSSAVLHRGATLTINATSEGQDFSHQLTFENLGKEGSGAQNLSCVIYNIRLMNCSWTRGPAAPADVRYKLYMWTSLHGNVSECDHYFLDSAGTRVGCHFDELGEGHTTDDYFFLVNGTSSETDIQFLDYPSVNGRRLEKYNPPANLTVKENVSHYLIRWDAPAIRYSLSNSVLRYALDIQKAGSFSKRQPVFLSRQYKNEYRLPSSDVTGEHTVRMRVQHVQFQIWSDWSSTHRFGVPEKNFLVVSIGLAVGAAVLFGMALMFLCKRLSLKKKLFPPIPQVKQELAGSFLASLEEWHLQRPHFRSRRPVCEPVGAEFRREGGRVTHDLPGPPPTPHPVLAGRGDPPGAALRPWLHLPIRHTCLRPPEKAEETASWGGHLPSASQDPEDIFTVEEARSLASGPAKMPPLHTPFPAAGGPGRQPVAQMCPEILRRDTELTGPPPAGRVQERPPPAFRYTPRGHPSGLHKTRTNGKDPGPERLAGGPLETRLPSPMCQTRV
ncbi:granulocyte-macrophage colony-stimulating factor receptor subunit alpha-like [Moschus berezovskii]|uniref:granulocyte-macrophage colony-stimulating factor receptor subunit alpha-like n=1 Tax=Moschus berezovskii TaxID=68408 RepID=UPI002444D148|nr:granulocyte-macrophage colony-stimulating factor receptor subunit alpha-like [Moschus berezovskii]